MEIQRKEFINDLMEFFWSQRERERERERERMVGYNLFLF